MIFEINGLQKALNSNRKYIKVHNLKELKVIRGFHDNEYGITDYKIKENRRNCKNEKQCK